MRAAAYEAKKDYDKAIADLDKAISLDATPWRFFLLRGIVYRDKGDLDRALAELNEKVKLDPDLSRAASPSAAISIACARSTIYPIADFDQVIKIEPEGPKGYIDRGWVFVLKDDLDKAQADFDTALEAPPERSFGAGRPRRGEEPQGQADRRRRRSRARQADRARHFRRDQEARRRVAVSTATPRVGSWAIRA